MKVRQPPVIVKSLGQILYVQHAENPEPVNTKRLSTELKLWREAQ